VPDPRGWARRYQLLLAAIDITAAAVAVALTVTLGPASASAGAGMVASALALPVAWVFILFLNRAYDRRFIGAGQAEFDRIFRAVTQLVLAVALLSYLTRAHIAPGFV